MLHVAATAIAGVVFTEPSLVTCLAKQAVGSLTKQATFLPKLPGYALR